MSASLYMGVCNKDRYDKALIAVNKKFEDMGRGKPKPIATVEHALSDPNLQRYFYRQRVQINSYYQQAKKESRKKYGDFVRDIKSLLVPYLFAMGGKKPAGDFKNFSKEMANANKYFINNVLSTFKPSLQPVKKNA